jgi:hypothetical protein
MVLNKYNICFKLYINHSNSLLNYNFDNKLFFKNVYFLKKICNSIFNLPITQKKFVYLNSPHVFSKSKSKIILTWFSLLLKKRISGLSFKLITVYINLIKFFCNFFKSLYTIQINRNYLLYI